MRFSRRNLLQHSKKWLFSHTTALESPLGLSGLASTNADEAPERRKVLLLRSQKRKLRQAENAMLPGGADPMLLVTALAQPSEEHKVAAAKVHDDVLARFPNATPAGILRGMDYMGTACFASTGCITAGLAGMDIVGCTLVGTITACGGGTVRDILLGKTPVFWVQEPEYLYLAAGTAFLTFCVWHFVGEDVERELTTQSCVFWMDSLGLGAFACIGVQNAVRSGLGVLPSVLCGLMTATFGGVIRDSLCGRPARILHAHDETYAAAPIASAAAYLAARGVGANLAQRIAFGVATSLIIRSFAVTNNYKLPSIHYVRERSTQAKAASAA